MEEKKLSDEEIVNALEKCVNKTHAIDCLGCPYFEKDIDCEVESDKYALDLILRLQKENEQLSNKAKEWFDNYTNLQDWHDEYVFKNADKFARFVKQVKAFVTQRTNDSMDIDMKYDEFDAMITNLAKEFLLDGEEK